MPEPFVSFIGASIRPQNWERIYNNLSEGNTVPFEIIFAGPYSSEGIYKLPENFKFIQTNVKPAQCLEITARRAKGEYLFAATDDMEFESCFLNKIKKWMNLLSLWEKILIGFRYIDCRSGNIKIGEKQTPIDDALVMDIEMENAPFMGLSPLFNRETYYQLGGIDRRFHSSLCEMDVTLRFYELGFSPFLLPDCIIKEIGEARDPNGLFINKGWKGRELLTSLWSTWSSEKYSNDNGRSRVRRVFSKKRMSFVESFSDENILTIDQ